MTNLKSLELPPIRLLCVTCSANLAACTCSIEDLPPAPERRGVTIEGVR